MFTCFDPVIKNLTKEMTEKLQYKDSHYSTILTRQKRNIEKTQQKWTKVLTMAAFEQKNYRRPFVQLTYISELFTFSKVRQYNFCYQKQISLKCPTRLKDHKYKANHHYRYLPSLL